MVTPLAERSTRALRPDLGKGAKGLKSAWVTSGLVMDVGEVSARRSASL
jgi:hypothetical protein